MGELKLSDVSVAALLPDVSCLTAILMQDCKKICVNMYKKGYEVDIINSSDFTPEPCLCRELQQENRGEMEPELF